MEHVSLAERKVGKRGAANGACGDVVRLPADEDHAQKLLHCEISHLI